MLALAGLSACATERPGHPDLHPAAKDDTSPARLFDGMGPHRRPVTTVSRDAQRYFDQGLTWAYAFNHDEAIRSFTEAARLDPSCAMAWWGIALAHGPHINNPAMSPEASAAAWDAIQRAMALRGHASPVERALIEALATRYAEPAPDDRAPLDRAYADAMRAVWHAHRADGDVGTLFAEAMMDLRPWDLWTQAGDPNEGTPEIVATLEAVLALDPDNPGANHLYIHAMEASRSPERALHAADRLRTLVPASGHLVHMPSHIDARLGQWTKASEANEAAIRADADYRRLVPRQGFYRVYMAHNHHFLAWASMMEGRRQAALDAAREMVRSIPDESLDAAAPMFDPVMAIVYDVQKRFGMWDELLAEPGPDPRLPITGAMWRFSRGLAHAAAGDPAKARHEQRLFREAVERIPGDAFMYNNTPAAVMGIAQAMLEGEIAYAEGDPERAIQHLTHAVALEDQLRYMEPAEWIQPVRHALASVLIAQRRLADAEAVLREDLRRNPGNGWSLIGLVKCLEADPARASEAADARARLDRAWARADIRPSMPCLCVPDPVKAPG
ncbi:MAG: hypothetical protein HRU70_03205 [Phycisphaeraceae bacterium]|nr:MAG: hypothetical protein HRU70_03205 [Phycisphaeraceae bacterium]